jgi:hypothetical protein
VADGDAEEFEVHGHFWLPSNSDKRIPGILTFDREQGGSLALIGSFSSESELFNESARAVSTIHGSSEKNDYTLIGCLTTHQSLQVISGLGRQQFSVNRIIEGALYTAGGPIEVDTLTVDYSYLLQWSGISGVQVSVTYNEQAGFVCGVSGTDTPSQVVQESVELGRLGRHSIEGP